MAIVLGWGTLKGRKTFKKSKRVILKRSIVGIQRKGEQIRLIRQVKTIEIKVKTKNIRTVINITPNGTQIILEKQLIQNRIV